MQQQSGQKESVTSSTHTSAKKTDKQNYLTEVEQIEGTPFVLRRLEDQYFTTMGDTIVTRKTNTKEEQYQQLKEESYQVIANMIIHVFTVLDRMKNTPNKGTQPKINEQDRMTIAGL